MRRAHQITCIVLVATGIYVSVEARNLDYYTEIGPGPGFLPFWLGLILVGLTLLWWIGEVRHQLHAMDGKSVLPDRKGLFRMFVVLAALVFAALLLDVVGYQLTSLMFLLLLLLVLGRPNPALTVAIAILGSFGLYYVFTYWLQVPLPVSSIEFLQSLGL